MIKYNFRLAANIAFNTLHSYFDVVDYDSKFYFIIILFIYLSDKYNTSNSNNIIVHNHIYPGLLGLLVTINTTC